MCYFSSCRCSIERRKEKQSSRKRILSYSYINRTLLVAERNSLPVFNRTISTVFARCCSSVLIFVAPYFNVGVCRVVPCGFSDDIVVISLNCSNLKIPSLMRSSNECVYHQSLTVCSPGRDFPNLPDHQIIVSYLMTVLN